MKKAIEITKVGFSINIERDYKDNEKINSYIPTEKNIKLLSKLTKDILNKKNGSYILSGAYGSGKSYFLSVLLNILSVKNNNEINIFLNRAEQKFPIKDLYSKLKDEKKLIVFAKDRFQSYEKAILHGILDTIKKENIDIALNLESRIILDKIENWKVNYTDIVSKFQNLLVIGGTNLEELENELKKNKEKAINIFKRCYKEIFYGENFINYESNFQILDLLEDFEKQVIEKTLYTGIVYVFDEFGRYLESNIDKLDVKEIQDMAEYCNLESNSFLFLITHKDIFQYTNKLTREDNIFEWEKVSGRFHKEQLTYDKVTSLSILSQVIYKNELFQEFYKENIEKFNLYKNDLLESKLLIENIENIIKEFYPLNYITAYILPELSQKIAQNERTMFAFLSSGDIKGLENIYEEEFLVGLDRVYDYFEENFKFLNHESIEYKSFFNTKKALNLVKNPEYIKFLKTLGVLQIYNRTTDLPPTKEILKLALNINSSQLEIILNDLENENIISYKRNKKQYKIVEDSDINIQKEIKEYVINKLHVINLTESLNKFLTLGTYYPVKYNFEKDITRFLNQMYLDCSNISDLDKVKENIDGTIVYLTNILKTLDYNYIKRTLELKDVIVISNIKNKSLKIEGILKELEAIECLTLLEKNYKNNAVLEEYGFYKEELIQTLKEELNRYFHKDNIKISYLEKEFSNEKLLDITYNYLNEKFYNYIEINYELINKEKISTPMKKARINLLDMLINNDKTLLEDEFYLETGAINSVARVVLSKIITIGNKSINFKNNWERLSIDIIESVKKKEYSLKELYFYYKTSKSGYGLRNGVLTFFLGAFLIKNKNTILVMNSESKQKENITGDLIERIEKNPELYYLVFVEKNIEEEEYLESFRDVLGIYYVDEPEIEVGIIEGLKNYFYSISRLINKIALKDCKFLSKVFNSLFQEKNPYEFVFKELLVRARANSYKEVIKILTQDMKYLEDEKLKIEQILKEKISKALGESREIKENLENWKEKNDILDNSFKIWLKKYIYKGERTFLLDITSKIKGFNYENWSTLEDIDDFDERLKEFLAIKENKLESSSSDNHVEIIYSGDKVVLEIIDEYTPIGKVLKTKLEATIKSMGLSLKEEEKKSILLQILRDL